MILRLIRNDRGQFAVIFALLMIPLMGLLGLGLDTALTYRMHQDLQTSLDAAIAAAIRTTDNAHRSEIARSFFESNWTGRGHKTSTDGSLKVSLSYDPDTKTLTGSARAYRNTVFMTVLGIKRVAVNASSSVHVGQPPIKVEGGCDRLDNSKCISER